jgi:AcrR family transcriptional regulator
MELFHEKGYAAAGIAEILQRAQANSGSFYYFFRSKEELLSAVLDRYAEILYPDLLEPIWRQTPDPVERVFALLAKYRELLITTNFRYGCPIGRIALEADPSMTDVHRKIAQNFDGWKTAVARCLVDALDQDRLPRTTNGDQLSCLVLSVMEGGVMQARSYGHIEPFDQSVEGLRTYFALMSGEAIPQCEAAARKRKRRARGGKQRQK